MRTRNHGLAFGILKAAGAVLAVGMMATLAAQTSTPQQNRDQLQDRIRRLEQQRDRDQERLQQTVQQYGKKSPQARDAKQQMKRTQNQLRDANRQMTRLQNQERQQQRIHEPGTGMGPQGMGGPGG
ncbi:MAG TPA: hypothetical protein VFD30_17505, partial [Terriglobia bacterium]|nr:hypothetical protein [Terriglobia bacterium]